MLTTLGLMDEMEKYFSFMKCNLSIVLCNILFCLRQMVAYKLALKQFLTFVMQLYPEPRTEIYYENKLLPLDQFANLAC